MKQQIEFHARWYEYNSGNASKGNIERIIDHARLLPNGGPLGRARRILVRAGVHKTDFAVPAVGRRPGAGLDRGAVGDHHEHITVLVEPPGATWHINVAPGKGGEWYPSSIDRYAGQRHFEPESPGRRPSD